MSRLQRGAVPAEKLVITTRVSKAHETYQQRTQTVAALEHAAAQGLGRPPREDVAYVVVDDSRSSNERVQLAHESLETYDTAFYTELLFRNAESIVAPLGRDRRRLEGYLDGTGTHTLAPFLT